MIGRCGKRPEILLQFLLSICPISLASYNFDLYFLNKNEKYSSHDCPARSQNRNEFRFQKFIGSHGAIFTSAVELITLAHHALDRRVFAESAVRVALWPAGRKPGAAACPTCSGLWRNIRTGS
ncbi:unnamed protein product [Acidocella sp. C78]|nr:dihydrodipicolinate reductase C-terminal domain-containing protein [Acidocella sp. C78]CAG4907367.1 unnamed protein product [Acidocella sp. C78]